MARITHIAVKVDDVDSVEGLYRDVFGLTSGGSWTTPGSRRVTFSDGTVNLTFLQYDSEEEPGAKAVGTGPAIHHFGIEVSDVGSYASVLLERGCELLSAPDEIPLKFRMPGGPIAELVPEGTFAGGVQQLSGS